MKTRLLLVTLLALIAVTLSNVESKAATNGIILISTRKAQDLSYATTDAYDQKGPGQASQGDVAMAALLGDNGYSSRIIVDAQLNDLLGGTPDLYFQPSDANMTPMLIIASGSSGSTDVPGTLTKGVAVMMGEHSCIGDRSNLTASDLYLYYGGSTSGNITDTATPPAGQYMKVTAAGKAHPILQGIPLDSQDRIKIFRDPYPEENAHIPTGGKKNYQYSWTAIDAIGATNTDTKVLGLLDSNTNKSVFGVIDIGGKLSNGSTANSRLVHWLVNEDGSGGARRMFNALTDIGRVIFLRTVKWAVGETLTPYKTFKIIDVTPAGTAAIKIRWEGSATKNYALLASDDIINPKWQTVVEDIHGMDGVVTRTFNIAAGPQTLFMKVRSLP